MQEIELEEKFSSERASKRRLTGNSGDEGKKKSSTKRRSTIFDKAYLSLTLEQRKFRVNIIKRNYDNNFYLNNIDQSIAFVIPYKYKCSIWMFLLEIQ